MIDSESNQTPENCNQTIRLSKIHSRNWDTPPIKLYNPNTVLVNNSCLIVRFEVVITFCVKQWKDVDVVMLVLELTLVRFVCVCADLPQTVVGMWAANREGSGHDLCQLEGANHV